MKNETLSATPLYLFSFPAILGGHPLDITRENSEGSFVKPVGLGLLVTTLVDSSVCALCSRGISWAVQEGPSGDCGGEEIGVLGFLNLK